MQKRREVDRKGGKQTEKKWELDRKRGPEWENGREKIKRGKKDKMNKKEICTSEKARGQKVREQQGSRSIEHNYVPSSVSTSAEQ